MGVLDLVGKAAKGAKKAAPFFSKADMVLDELPRGKGLGNEFLGELVKKGAKPTELRERGIEKALKDKPKMTKAEVQKIFEEKAPPKVQEKVLSSDVPDYDEWLENKAQEIYGVDWFDLRKDEQSRLNKMYGDLELTQYDRYKTPGGENYREILLKLPVNTANAKILEAGTNKTSGKPFVSFELNGERYVVEKTAGETDQQAVSRRIGGMPERGKVSGSDTYTSSHYKTDPNLLAHIRVQDFKTPDGKKVLLVDEIQSDWHQAGRDLRNKEIKRIMNETGVDKKTASAQVPDDYGYKTNEQLREAKTVIDKDGYWEVRDQNNEFITNIMGYQYPDADQAKILEIANARISEDVPTRIKQSEKVPDAPFKKNWHELAMKRVLDYAAENGYDSIAITPGVQQVKRYEDATRQAVDEVAMYGDTLVGFKNGRRVIEQPISSPDELEQYIGKDMAQKLSSAAPDMNFIRSIKGEDITVGGEGMKGFYDKILPDYLNNFGKPYGSSVGEMRLPVAPADSTKVQGYNLGDEYMQGRATWSEFLQANPDAAQNFSPAFHSFDITPQLREEVKAKGLPMYGKVSMPVLEGLAAGSGAATIGSQMFDENNEQQVQNPVHFTENPDAMLLELMQRN